MTLSARLDYKGSRVTADHLAISERDREGVMLPIASIRALSMQRGLTAERPLLEALLGIASCLLAGLALRRVVWWFEP